MGEETNRILLFIIASSYKMPDTLHGLIQGSSGSGKPRLGTFLTDIDLDESTKTPYFVTNHDQLVPVRNN